MDLLIIREKKNNKTNFPEVGPFFGHFCTKSAKIRPQFFQPLYFLTFYSAPFELCSQIFGQLATQRGDSQGRDQHNIIMKFQGALRYQNSDRLLMMHLEAPIPTRAAPHPTPQPPPPPPFSRPTRRWGGEGISRPLDSDR